MVVRVLEQLLDTVELQIECEDVVRQASVVYREGLADFADYVIACGNRLAGCEVSYSFDQKLAEYANVRQP